MNNSTKDLPTTATQGYCYFDVRDGKWWVDIANGAIARPSTTTSVNVNRMPLNAYQADKATTANYSTTASYTNNLGMEARSATKTYLLGTITSPTNSKQSITSVAETGVYLTPTTGELSAVRHSFNIEGTEKAYMNFNSTTNAIDFVFN